jgi:transcriptional regulator with XRE-family HTH domain
MKPLLDRARATREPRVTPMDAHVGERVRLARNLAGMSQAVLADRLGISFQQVQRYERGLNRIGASRLFDMARAMSVPIAFLFGNEEDDVARAQPRPATRTPPDIPPELLPGSPHRAEALELVRAFERISDPMVQEQVFALLRAIAAENP